MRKSENTEEQIIGILMQHEAGVKTADRIFAANTCQRRDVLELEIEVRRPGRERSIAPAADGR